MPCNVLGDALETARRSFLSSVAFVFLGARCLLAQSSQRRPAGGMPPPFPELNPKWQLKENQKKLRHDANQLLELAKALKEDADETEEVNVLSLSLVRKAEEIEKLAKQIKGLARAA
jgi:hypothetical protein